MFFNICSLDSLASCAFGVDGGSFKDPNAIFVRNAARIFQNTKWDLFMLSVRFTPVRYLLNWFKLDTNKSRETRFFRDLVRQVSWIFHHDVYIWLLTSLLRMDKKYYRRMERPPASIRLHHICHMWEFLSPSNF